jgi:hypothetical protein
VFIRELVEALDRHGVRYAVVGGVAVNLHGVPRMTYDIDIVVKTDAATLGACEVALGSIGLAPRLPLRLGDLSGAAERERLEAERNLTALTFTDPSNPLREVDVLIGPSIDPDGIVDRAGVSDAGSFRVSVAGLADLIAMKRRAGRPQDLADISHLERIAAGKRS